MSCAEGSPPIAPAVAPAAPDPDFEAFAVVFAAERSAKYGNQRGGWRGPTGAPRFGAMALDLVDGGSMRVGAGPRAQLDRGAVRDDLCRRMVRTWLTWAGTADYLITRPDPHPMGLIAGDIARLGVGSVGRVEALAAATEARARRAARRACRDAA